MNEQKEKKNKHMTLDDRIEIQQCLNAGVTFKAIAQRIGKDPTTVSKEVKLHATEYANSFTITEDTCPKLLKAPFVCNACPRKNSAGCRHRRRVYSAKTAHADYRTVLHEAREGIPLNRESFYHTEAIISRAVNAGQHIYHAVSTYNLPVSTATVYRHISKGYYTISKIDLPRAVKFKPRKEKASNYVPKGVKIGRSYEDFLQHISSNAIEHYVEMDTIIGRPGGKVILTLHFTAFDFMIGLLLDDKTAAEAGNKITILKQQLAQSGFSFGDIFPVILTDNGGEFSHVSTFENDLDGQKESFLFFCNPNSPYQKPHIENNHTLFRNIVPSGSSFDHFSQQTINLIFSHVNSVKRKQFNGKSSFEMFAFSYSVALASALGISFIPPEKVIQSRTLLG